MTERFQYFLVCFLISAIIMGNEVSVFAQGYDSKEKIRCGDSIAGLSRRYFLFTDSSSLKRCSKYVEGVKKKDKLIFKELLSVNDSMIQSITKFQVEKCDPEGIFMLQNYVLRRECVIWGESEWRNSRIELISGINKRISAGRAPRSDDVFEYFRLLFFWINTKYHRNYFFQYPVYLLAEEMEHIVQNELPEIDTNDKIKRMDEVFVFHNYTAFLNSSFYFDCRKFDVFNHREHLYLLSVNKQELFKEYFENVFNREYFVKNKSFFDEFNWSSSARYRQCVFLYEHIKKGGVVLTIIGHGT